MVPSPHTGDRGQAETAATMSSSYNLLFQEAKLTDDAGERQRSEFLGRVPGRRRIEAFLRSRDPLNHSPQFAELYELQIAIFVASVPSPDNTRIVVAGVTNVTQGQFDKLAAGVGRGTARWNRSEFKRSVETILDIEVRDYAEPH
jgi:hypothetical protein